MSFRVRALLHYWWRARCHFHVHSPFVYDFFQKVLLPKSKKEFGKKAEEYRGRLLKDQAPLFKTHQGANSKRLVPERKTVAEEASKSGIAPKYGHLLMQMVHYYQLCNILELGTSLGLGTAYLALGQSHLNEKQLISIEGCPSTYQSVKSHFKELKASNPELGHVQIRQGRFEEQGPKALGALKQLDLLFLDGDHQYDSVLQNFQLCAGQAHQNAIFIIDDIHWSPGMLKAWKTIQAMPNVTLTIDLFQMGVVFFNPRLAKENLVLRY